MTPHKKYIKMQKLTHKIMFNTLVNRKIQTKTSMSYYWLLIRIAKIKIKMTSADQESIQQLETANVISGYRIKQLKPFDNFIWLNIHLPAGPRTHF
jgi:hypothetical protein